MKTKVCSKCNKRKSLSEFHNDRCKSDGKYTICRQCVISKRRLEYITDRERILKNNRRYKLKNRDRVLARRRELSNLQYRDKSSRVYLRSIEPKTKFNAYKRGAKSRNLSFNLSFDKFKTYWNKHCYYCGDQIDGIGLDRVDPSKGYFTDNIVPSCFTCNKSKSALSKKDFMKMIKKIYRKHFISS